MWARSYCLTSASTRLRVSQGGFGSRPEKNMLYSASSRLSSASSRVRSRSISLGATGFPLPLNEKPDERQPELRARTAPADRQSALRWRRRVRRSRTPGAAARRRDGQKPDAVAMARRRFPVSRNSAAPRARSSARSKVRHVERRKHQRDRERMRRRPEQRLVQIGIERRELLVGRLLRQIGVRPEPLERSVLHGGSDAYCRIAGLQQECRKARVHLQCHLNPAILESCSSVRKSWRWRRPPS